tara:strand:+ start:2374 stop:2583 length:210 start_codon:yes stop_codon:yes gene_type:complete
MHKRKEYDVQDTLDKAGIERLWRGVSKTNVKDIEELKYASQLRKTIRQTGVKKWLLNIGQSLKKKLQRS